MSAVLLWMLFGCRWVSRGPASHLGFIRQPKYETMAQALASAGFIGPHLEDMYYKPSTADLTASNYFTVGQSLVPREYLDNGAPYCSSNDFPCGEGDGPIEPGYVYICHLTIGRGYRQLCIPEESSEMLIVFRSDYCGPCKGGFKVVFDDKFYGEERSELEL